MTYWTLENAGLEKTLADWGIDSVSATFVSQAEEVCDLMVRGRRYDAAYLFAFKSAVVIRRDRVLANGVFSGGTQYFSGLVARPSLAASGRSESQACAVVGPWWYLNERGFEQEYRKIASLTEGVPTFVTPNPTTSRIILNQELGEYGISTPNKLTTGEQMVQVLEWVLKPFTDAAADPPFQFSESELETNFTVDPPVDEVKNITCAEALRKMFRWSPDAIAWFDHSTSPPTFHAARRASLESFVLDVESTRPETINIQPRHDLQRPFVRIQYEITGSIGGQSTFSIEERIWPDPLPTGVLDQYGGVPFVVDLRGATINGMEMTVKTRAIDTASESWWLDHHPAYKVGSVNGRVTGFAIVPGSVLVQTEDGETNLNLPNELIGATPVDFITAPGGAPARYQRLSVSCKAAVTFSNTGELHDDPISFQMVSTDAESGTYVNHEGDMAGDAIPVGLERDFYDAISVLHYAGTLTFRAQEVGGLPRLGHKLNITGNDRSEWSAMNALVQRVTEDLFSGQTTVEIGPPPHLSLDDLVSLFRVTRERFIETPYAQRSTGRAGARQGAFSQHTPRANSSTAIGNYKKMVASGSPTPNSTPAPADELRGLITHDGGEKRSTWMGANGEGSITLQLGANDVELTTRGHDISLYEIETCETVDGVKSLWTRVFACSERYKKPWQ